MPVSCTSSWWSNLAREKVDLKDVLEQALETKQTDQMAPLSDSNGCCWSGTGQCWKTCTRSCARRLPSHLATSTTRHRRLPEPQKPWELSFNKTLDVSNRQGGPEEELIDWTVDESKLKEELNSTKRTLVYERERDARFILDLENNMERSTKKKERDVRSILDLRKSLDWSSEELKNAENGRRAADIAATEMRGRANAKKEALLADKHAANARAGKYIEFAAHVKDDLDNYKAEAEDTCRNIDEAQEWKRRYEALAARMEAMLATRT